MTLATEAYEAFNDWCEAHGIQLKQDETGRATLRAMHDQIYGRNDTGSGSGFAALERSRQEEREKLYAKSIQINDGITDK